MDLHNNKKASPLTGFSEMFRYSLRQNLIFLLLVFVLLACVFPVRTGILLGNMVSPDYDNVYMYTSSSVYIDRVDEIARSLFEPLSLATFWAGLFAAIMLSSVMFGYLHSKRSINFFHSLPVRREAKFLASLLASAVYYIGSLFVNMLISLVLVLSQGAGAEYIGTAALSLLFNGVFFIFISSFFALFAVICASAGAHIFFALAGLLALPGLHLITIIFTTFNSNLDMIYFYPDILLYLETPLALYFMKSETGLAIGELFIWVGIYLAAAVLFIFIALLIYRRLHSENAGSAIAFPRLARVVKYILTYGIMVSVSYLFCMMTDGNATVISALVSALVFGYISFAVINVIFTRNKKKFFAEKRGFFIMFAAVAVMFVSTYFGSEALNDWLPRPQNIAELRFPLNGEYYVINDDEDIAYLIGRISESRAKGSSYGGYSAKDASEKAEYYEENRASEKEPYSVYSSAIQLAVKLECGITFGKQMYISVDEETAHLLTSYRTIESGIEYIIDNKNDIERVQMENAAYYNASFDKELAKALRADLENMSEQEYLDGRFLNTVRVVINEGFMQNNIYLELQLSTAMENTLSYLKLKNPGLMMYPEDIIDSIEYIYIWTENSIESDFKFIIDDKEQIKQVMESIVGSDDYHGVIANFYDETDERYNIEISYRSGYEDGYRFIKGKIPDFVTEHNDKFLGK